MVTSGCLRDPPVTGIDSLGRWQRAFADTYRNKNPKDDPQETHNEKDKAASSGAKYLSYMISSF